MYTYIIWPPKRQPHSLSAPSPRGVKMRTAAHRSALVARLPGMPGCIPVDVQTTCKPNGALMVSGTSEVGVGNC